MQTSTIGRGFLAVSVSLALTTPAVVYGHGWSHNTSYQNFTSDQIVTQAERDLVKRVRQRIREDQEVKTYADNLQIKAQRGKIMLMGEVKNERDKDEIATTVKHTLGVTGIENDLRLTGSASL